MEPAPIRHGNHGGYAYSCRTSEGYNFDSHIHRCYEFLYIMEGTFFYTVEGNEYILSPGDLIVTNPDELHSFSFPEKCSFTRQFLHVYPNFVSAFPELLSELDARVPGTRNYIPASLFQKYNLGVIFSGLKEYCQNPVPETHLMALTYSIQLIVKISTILRHEDLSAPAVSINKNTYKIREYIDRHFTRNIHLDELSQYMFMDKAYLCRLFKQETGMTIRTYINMRRIIRAKNLILSGKKASNIYAECGFQDYSTFYRSFHKYVGMTPERFKQAHTIPLNTI